MEKIDIKSMNQEELTAYVVGLGFPKFRAKQLYEWMHVKLAESIDVMHNLPQNLKDKLKQETNYISLIPVDVQVSKEDSTAKYLFQLYDGNLIESVLMRYEYGNSVCISSQAGCRMGCKFCASTIDGLSRNLTPSEMVDQIYRIQSLTGERVSNVVIMGSGEPFDNFDNFIKFEQLITVVGGLNISARNLTVSSCGIVPKIYELADLHLQLTLAISLHSPVDSKRKELMPIANKYSISEIIKACKYYIAETGRRVTFEYSLVKGENDTEEMAQLLIERIKDINCHVNLIPINPIKERTYEQSNQGNIKKFKNKLEKNGINVTIRREMGRDIDGACGQLRRSYTENNI